MTVVEPQATPDAISVEVLKGDPTEEELAALVAVVSESYAAEAGDAVADETTAVSAWAVTQRSMRQPLARELGWVRGATSWQG
ncbi:acyl-CoA carboxylase subunit epsilon [Microbacterium sp. BWT-B31]|uniref:acyl-CoA carboxylase subunit epsilon n=1 Tax=Microbacterium sp. BWT-B31 TaxID=3232072 RepID=UPI00352796D5